MVARSPPVARVHSPGRLAMPQPSRSPSLPRSPGSLATISVAVANLASQTAVPIRTPTSHSTTPTSEYKHITSMAASVLALLAAMILSGAEADVTDSTFAPFNSANDDSHVSG